MASIRLSRRRILRTSGALALVVVLVVVVSAAYWQVAQRRGVPSAPVPAPSSPEPGDGVGALSAAEAFAALYEFASPDEAERLISLLTGPPTLAGDTLIFPPDVVIPPGTDAPAVSARDVLLRRGIPGSRWEALARGEGDMSGGEGDDTFESVPEDVAMSLTPSVETVLVQITAGGFTPNRVTVKPQTTVLFTNRDLVVHRILPDAAVDASARAGFDSGALQPGESFGFTFSRPGVYGYYDERPPLWDGQVIVSE